MISDEPSKMRLMRASRMARSTPTGDSPRAASEASFSYPRPPRICMVSSTIRHAFTVFHSLAAAASRRMS